MTRSRILPPVELTIKATDFGFEYEMWRRGDDFAFGLKSVIVRLYEGCSSETDVRRLHFTIMDPSALLNGRRGEPGRLRLVDGWLLRDQFLKIKNPDDAFRFFALNGLVFLLSSPKRRERPFIALFSDVRRCQEMVADALASPLAEHLRRGFPQDWRCGLGALPINLRVADERSTAEMIFEDGLTAIMATVQIDRAWGTKFQRCVRCGSVYERKSKHQQKYCPPSCAHAAAEQMRRDRAKAKTKQRNQRRSN
jgi:hypothetical protein